MHDLKLIRDFPDLFDAGLIRRNAQPLSSEILALDERLRALQASLQAKLTSRNDIAKNIGLHKSRGEDITEMMKNAEELKAEIPVIESKIDSLVEGLHHKLSLIPNLPDDSVPEGIDENDNLEIRKGGIIREFSFTPKPHFELGENLQQMDFEVAAKMSGSRFVVLKNDLAQLERALANFMLDIHTNEFEYCEISPPFLVKDEAMYGVGQLPKFDQDSFRTREGYRLIPTAEVSMTNLVADTIVAEEELPLRYTAYSPCFRSEAGSAGRDTRGMFRQHQFSKVELVSIVRPQDSSAEHERMTSCAEEILKRLELPFRTVLLCAGDMGFQSQKTYDIEVWLPSQDRYREISSCSNCGDFQARRIKARYKELTSRKNCLLHTLNGSGLAIGRTIIAILENYQNADGSIAIPSKLQEYMGGKKVISRG